MKIFDKAIDGMSWYEYSRHAISVFVYYLRSYDHLFQSLDERELLDTLTFEQIVEFTNAVYDEWPIRKPDWSVHPHLGYDSDHMNSLDILSTDIPLVERMMYISLDTWFVQDHFAAQLQKVREYIKGRIEGFTPF